MTTVHDDPLAVEALEHLVEIALARPGTTPGTPTYDWLRERPTRLFERLAELRRTARGRAA